MEQVYNYEIQEIKIGLKERTAGLIEGTIKPAVNFEVVLCLKTIFVLVDARYMPSEYVDFS